jgi:hypothetical protein
MESSTTEAQNKEDTEEALILAKTKKVAERMLSLVNSKTVLTKFTIAKILPKYFSLSLYPDYKDTNSSFISMSMIRMVLGIRTKSCYCYGINFINDGKIQFDFTLHKH